MANIATQAPDIHSLSPHLSLVPTKGDTVTIGAIVQYVTVTGVLSFVADTVGVGGATILTGTVNPHIDQR